MADGARQGREKGSRKRATKGSGADGKNNRLPTPFRHPVAADDAGFVTKTIDLFTAYRKAKGPAELHVFQIGAHGFGKRGTGTKVTA